MRIAAKSITLAVLIPLGLASFLSGQSRGRPQTFESVVTLQPRNAAAPASLSGLVVSEATGEPLVGATVTLTPYFDNAVLALLAEGVSSPPPMPVRTNDSGGFSLKEVPAGSYDVNVRMEGYIPRTPGDRATDTRREPVVLKAGQQIDDFKVSLLRSARIEGRIRNDAGPLSNPIPLRLVPEQPNLRAGRWENPVAETVSAPDGTYRLDGFLPGRYVLIAGTPLMLNGEPAQSFAATLTVPSTSPQTLDVSLNGRGGFVIRGKLTLDGTPVLPAKVSLSVRAISPGGTGLTPRTGANISGSYSPETGSFEIPALFPGIYEINASLMDPQVMGACSATVAMISDADVSGLEMILKPCL